MLFQDYSSAVLGSIEFNWSHVIAKSILHTSQMHNSICCTTPFSTPEMASVATLLGGWGDGGVKIPEPDSDFPARSAFQLRV